MKRSFQIILTAAIGCAIVGGGLLLGGLRNDLAAVGGIDPVTGYFTHEMPAFPGSQATPLGKGLSFNGMPMEIAFYQTEKPVAELRDFYAARFKAMKLKTSVTDNAGESVVFGNDEKANVQRIVAIQRVGSMTYVFPSVVPLLAVPATGAPEKSDVAVLPGSIGYTEITSSDYGRPSRVVTFHNEKDVAENAAFIKTRMAELGWKEDALWSPDSVAVMHFTRPGRDAVFTLLSREAPGMTSVLVNVQGKDEGK